MRHAGGYYAPLLAWPAPAAVSALSAFAAAPVSPHGRHFPGGELRKALEEAGERSEDAVVGEVRLVTRVSASRGSALAEHEDVASRRSAGRRVGSMPDRCTDAARSRDRGRTSLVSDAMRERTLRRAPRAPAMAAHDEAQLPPNASPLRRGHRRTTPAPAIPVSTLDESEEALRDPLRRTGFGPACSWPGRRSARPGRALRRADPCLVLFQVGSRPPARCPAAGQAVDPTPGRNPSEEWAGHGILIWWSAIDSLWGRARSPTPSSVSHRSSAAAVSGSLQAQPRIVGGRGAYAHALLQRESFCPIVSATADASCTTDRDGSLDVSMTPFELAPFPHESAIALSGCRWCCSWPVQLALPRPARADEIRERDDLGVVVLGGSGLDGGPRSDTFRRASFLSSSRENLPVGPRRKRTNRASG